MKPTQSGTGAASSAIAGLLLGAATRDARREAERCSAAARLAKPFAGGAWLAVIGESDRRDRN